MKAHIRLFNAAIFFVRVSAEKLLAIRRLHFKFVLLLSFIGRMKIACESMLYRSNDALSAWYVVRVHYIYCVLWKNYSSLLEH